MMKKVVLKFSVISFLVFLVLLSLTYLIFLTFFGNRFFPGVKIAGVNVSGQSPASVYQYFDSQFRQRTSEPLKFVYDEQTYTVTFDKAAPQLNLRQQIDEAYNIGRSGSFLENLSSQFSVLVFGTDLPLLINYQNENYLAEQFSQIALLIKKSPVNASLLPGEQITVSPSQDGKELDTKLLQKQIAGYLTISGPMPESLPTKVTVPQFSTAIAERAKKALDNIKVSPLNLRFEKEVWTIDQAVLLSLLDLHQTKPVLASAELPGISITIEDITVGENRLSDSELLLDKTKLSNYLKDLSDQISQPTKDARFNFDPGTKRAVEFQPEQEGRELDLDQTKILITKALEKHPGKDITLPVKVTKPKVTASSINNFGIRELLGAGISHFAGSIENRIYNIGLASSRLNGTLVPPGETFSFNATVGEISGASGYKPAYVIKSGRTVLDDGGGVCQVSTTLFRSILNAGLPITERTAHAYRVGYYEQGFPPGLDATVFSPTVDFKFRNDTPAHILIQAHPKGTSLFIDIYGTSDGRVARLTTPIVTNQTPPPAELRQDDPTLPRGTVKQVDWSAWGANVSFKRTVTRGSETLISETFRSNFKPWQAVYLVGTQ